MKRSIFILLILLFLIGGCDHSVPSSSLKNVSTNSTGANNKDVGITNTGKSIIFLDNEGGNNRRKGEEIDVLLNKKEYNKVEKLLRDNKKEIDKKDYLRYEGRLNFEKGNYKEALDYYMKLNKLENSNNKEVLYMIGVVYDNLHNKIKAKKYILKSLEIDPDYDLAKNYLKNFEN